MNPKGKEFSPIAPSSRPVSREPRELWSLMKVSPSGFWQMATAQDVQAYVIHQSNAMLECPRSQFVQCSIGLAL